MTTLIEGKFYLPDGTAVAAVKLRWADGRYSGSVDVTEMPPIVHQLFDRYNQIVENQVLSLLDEVEMDIQSLGLYAVLDGQDRVEVTDIQLFPGARQISFLPAVSTTISVAR